MLQGRIWGRGTGKAGEWKALTQGTQGKRQKKLFFHTCCEFQLGFCSQSCGIKDYYIKNSMGPISGLVKIWWNCLTRYMQQVPRVLLRFHLKFPNSHQSCGMNDQALKRLQGTDWCSVWVMVSVSDPLHSFFIASHPLGLSACFLCVHVKKEISYPTHLSPPKTVEWLGRYAQFSSNGPICPGRGGGCMGSTCSAGY